MPTPPELILAFEDREALEAAHERDLCQGRAFVPGCCEVAERQRCTLTLVHPESGATLALAVEAVWVKRDGPGAGVGVELLRQGESPLPDLAAFVRGEKGEPAARDGAAPSTGDNVYARVRHYNTAEQLRAARQGDHAERVALERVYGKAVWEVLLRNPRITPPEVTRLARNPKLPRHLVDVIVGNQGWLASSALRRSLLMNPQLGGAALEKVLRAMPAAEVTRVARQGSFPITVRQAAKRIQGR